MVRCTETVIDLGYYWRKKKTKKSSRVFLRNNGETKDNSGTLHRNKGGHWDVATRHRRVAGFVQKASPPQKKKKEH